MTIQEAVEKAIRDFDFDDYGLDEVDPQDEDAEWVPFLARDIVTSALAEMPEHTLMCSLCMFSGKSPEALTEDEKAERAVVTVINGHMVCLSHQGYVSGGEHSLMIHRMNENEAR